MDELARRLQLKEAREEHNHTVPPQPTQICNPTEQHLQMPQEATCNNSPKNFNTKCKFIPKNNGGASFGGPKAV